MKVVEESRLCGGTDFGVHIHRRLSKDYEYDASSEVAFVHLAMIRVMLSKIEKEYT